MRKSILAAALAILAAGCVSKSEYDRQIEQVTAISAEKDSLLKEVVQTSAFIAEVNGELDKVKNAAPVSKPTGEMEQLSPAQQREALAERVKGLTERLRTSEDRLAQSRRRVNQLTANNTEMQARIASYDSTLKAFQSLIDNQKAEIVALLEQVSTLTAENMALRESNTQLESQRAALTAEKSALTTEQNTVYWVAGRKTDLLRRGIIEQRGGMLGIGRTQVLARRIDTAEFTAVDRLQLKEISLPNPSKSYKIVSINDVTGLEAPPTNGRVKGTLKIASPATFWRPSKFLVLMEM